MAIVEAWSTGNVQAYSRAPLSLGAITGIAIKSGDSIGRRFLPVEASDFLRCKQSYECY